MKVVYPICYSGIEVYKRLQIATVITTKAGEITPHYQKNDFQPLITKFWH